MRKPKASFWKVKVKEKTKVLGVRIPVSLWGKLEEERAITGLSWAEFMAALYNEYLNGVYPRK